MFEKEAEEYGEKDLGGKYLSSVVAKDKLHAYKLGQYDGFVAGAELGYNKANEWHEDSPTEDIRLAIIEVKDCGYLLCEYRKGVWYDEGSSAVCKDWITRNIKRWKEIVLPELKESD